MVTYKITPNITCDESAINDMIEMLGITKEEFFIRFQPVDEETLTSDDYYEIEKAMDIYSSYYLPTIDKLSSQCFAWEGKFDDEPPMKQSLINTIESYNRMKNIRDKLKLLRLKKTKE